MKDNSKFNFIIISVDFDGTLCINNFPLIGRPNHSLIIKLLRRKNNGDKLILNTCRNGKLLDEAINWCKSWGLHFDSINEDIPEVINSFEQKSNKIFAHIYLDDRNMGIQEFIEL